MYEGKPPGKYKEGLKIFPFYVYQEVVVFPCEKQPPVSKNDILNSINNLSNLPEQEANNLAEVLITRFGYESRMIDNAIEQEERKYFNQAEEIGIIFRSTEECKLNQSKVWRAFYWILDKNKITAPIENKNKIKDQYQELYSSISEEDWGKHSN